MTQRSYANPGKFRNVNVYTEYPCLCGEGTMEFTGWVWSSGDHLARHGKEYLHVCLVCGAQEVLTHIYPYYEKTPWPRHKKHVKGKQPKDNTRAIKPDLNWRTNPNLPIPLKTAKLLGIPVDEDGYRIDINDDRTADRVD